ncbi:hypothetical protein AB0K60_13215 [Thermopolyspora sp. NPDC052614]|uniref:hypothetical protein n=1 Tax=Thermopolyspora sp. NPDC052614 TaxID=3155682 RepID=UPI0034251072
MNEKTPEVRVNIVVDTGRFDSVVQAVRQAGVTVDDRSPAIGVVSGRITGDDTDAAIAAISAIDGVVAVEPERTIRLPPPESEIQ